MSNVPNEVAVKDAPVVETDSREKVSMREFCEQLQYRLDDYDIDFSYQLDDLREQYQIVDEAGNSIDEKVDFGEFDASAFVEVSYQGTLLSPEERAVDDFKQRVKYLKRIVEQLWQDQSEKKLDRGGSYYSFGGQLSSIVQYANVLQIYEREALQEINSIERLSSSEKESYKQQIYDLNLSVNTFIEEGDNSDKKEEK